ncbi:MAG: hypothetical protein WAM04_18210 [Candidatus Sulfotelmatobacter sp.]
MSVPAAVPVAFASPVLLTVAILVFEDVHTALVRVLVAPLAYVPMAVNCCVVTAPSPPATLYIPAFAGVTENRIQMLGVGHGATS